MPVIPVHNNLILFLLCLRRNDIYIPKDLRKLINLYLVRTLMLTDHIFIGPNILKVPITHPVLEFTPDGYGFRVENSPNHEILMQTNKPNTPYNDQNDKFCIEFPDTGVRITNENIVLRSNFCKWGFTDRYTHNTEIKEYTAIAISSDHILALDQDGHVWGAGCNNYCQLGFPFQQHRNNKNIGYSFVRTFSKSPHFIHARGIYCYNKRSFIITKEGDVWMCGKPSPFSDPIPLSHNIKKLNVSNIRKLSAGVEHITFLDDNGEIWSQHLKEDPKIIDLPYKIRNIQNVDYGTFYITTQGLLGFFGLYHKNVLDLMGIHGTNKTWHAPTLTNISNAVHLHFDYANANRSSKNLNKKILHVYREVSEISS